MHMTHKQIEIPGKFVLYTTISSVPYNESIDEGKFKKVCLTQYSHINYKELKNIPS